MIRLSSAVVASHPAPIGLPVVDREPTRAQFRAEVLAGLSARPKTLPCKWFYDARGCALFEQICALDEYYPTRTELAILDAHGAAMADCCGSRCVLIEPGAGSLGKTRRLLDRLDAPAAYVPVDIAGSFVEAAAALDADYPGVAVRPVVADFTRPFPLPALPRDAGRRVVFFPGSTIGNFGHDAAVGFLRRCGAIAGADGGVLLGTDLVKDPAMLVAAYDDAAGVTAAFNRNLLDRINRELGGDFNPDAFDHRATWNAEARRIEMFLVSRAAQHARVGDRLFRFREGEAIATEHSHKYEPAQVAAMAAEAGLERSETWTDPRGWFAVHWLAVASGR